MSSTLATSFLLVKSPPLASPGHLSASNNSRSPASARVRTLPRAAPPSSSSNSSDEPDRVSYINRVAQSLKTLTKAAILIGAAASIAAKPFPALARAPAPVAVSETLKERADNPCVSLIESEPESVEKIKYYVQEKVLGGEVDEALKILDWMTEAQPSANEWNFFKARVLRGIGRTGDARKVFEEILVKDPMSFEASFEHALLMDSCGEGEVVNRRLQEALDVAVGEDLVKDTSDGTVEEVKESRDVRLIKAQMQLLQKNVEGALASYQELTNEDPSDFRPYFCRAMIYGSLDRIEEAEEDFYKYYELTQKMFDVGAYMRVRC